jgi:hypothetical protein
VKATRYTIPPTAPRGDWYSLAERGDEIRVPTFERCRCGFKHSKLQNTARIWYFTRRNVGTTAVVALCAECDRSTLAEMEAGR